MARDLTYRPTTLAELRDLSTIHPARDMSRARERWRRQAPDEFKALADDVPLDNNAGSSA